MLEKTVEIGNATNQKLQEQTGFHSTRYPSTHHASRQWALRPLSTTKSLVGGPIQFPYLLRFHIVSPSHASTPFPHERKHACYMLHAAAVEPTGVGMRTPALIRICR
jgi:hypothetical protein